MSNASARHALFLAVALLGLQGCAKPMPGPERMTRVEVYFRDFDAMSAQRQTPESLPRNATVNVVITDPPTIARVMASVTLPCASGASRDADPMDLHLLVRAFDGKRLVAVRRASRFNIEQFPEERRCPLAASDRARIGGVMASLRAH